MTNAATATRRRALRALVGTGSLTVGVALAGCTDGGSDGESPTVDMTDDLTFDPETITVSSGSTVTWTNVGSVAHSVTAYQDVLPEDATYFASGGAASEEEARSAYPDQGQIAAGESYEHTFEVAGTFAYFCIPHEGAGMKGSVEVGAE